MRRWNDGDSTRGELHWTSGCRGLFGIYRGEGRSQRRDPIDRSSNPAYWKSIGRAFHHGRRSTPLTPEIGAYGPGRHSLEGDLRILLNCPDKQNLEMLGDRKIHQQHRVGRLHHHADCWDALDARRGHH